MEAVETEFTNTSDNELSSFKHVNLQTTTAYLYATYRHISEQDLEINNIKMTKAYNSSLPISKLIKHMEEGRRLAATEQKLITKNMIMTNGINLLEQTATFIEDIKKY